MEISCTVNSFVYAINFLLTKSEIIVLTVSYFIQCRHPVNTVYQLSVNALPSTYSIVSTKISYFVQKRFHIASSRLYNMYNKHMALTS